MKSLGSKCVAECIFNCCVLLFGGWIFALIILLGIYSDKELVIESTWLGKAIIAQNVLMEVAFILTILSIWLDYNPYSKDHCYHIAIDILWSFVAILYVVSWLLGWIVFGGMCHYQQCFYYTTPLYIMTIVYNILMTLVIIELIIIISRKCCCEKCCLKCSEKCNWWCYGIRPKWQEPEKVEVKVNKS